MTSLREMVEEHNARPASRSQALDKPAESIPNKPNVTEPALSIGQQQSTSPRSETSLQPGNETASQGNTSDVKSNSSNLPEPTTPSGLPSATTVLDMGSRVLGIGLSISALLSMHRDSLRPEQQRADPLYGGSLAPDTASMSLSSAAPDANVGTSSTANISKASYSFNEEKPPTATNPLALRDSESNTQATSGQGEFEGSNDQAKTSDTEDTGQNHDISTASLERKRSCPEDESRIDTSPEPESMHEGRCGGGGMPIKARLGLHLEPPRQRACGTPIDLEEIVGWREEDYGWPSRFRTWMMGHLQLHPPVSGRSASFTSHAFHQNRYHREFLNGTA